MVHGVSNPFWENYLFVSSCIKVRCKIWLMAPKFLTAPFPARRQMLKLHFSKNIHRKLLALKYLFPQQCIRKQPIWCGRLWAAFFLRWSNCGLLLGFLETFQVGGAMGLWLGLGVVQVFQLLVNGVLQAAKKIKNTCSLPTPPQQQKENETNTWNSVITKHTLIPSITEGARIKS